MCSADSPRCARAAARRRDRSAASRGPACKYIQLDQDGDEAFIMEILRVLLVRGVQAKCRNGVKVAANLLQAVQRHHLVVVGLYFLLIGLLFLVVGLLFSVIGLYFLLIGLLFFVVGLYLLVVQDAIKR